MMVYMIIYMFSVWNTLDYYRSINQTTYFLVEQHPFNMGWCNSVHIFNNHLLECSIFIQCPPHVHLMYHLIANDPYIPHTFINVTTQNNNIRQCNYTEQQEQNSHRYMRREMLEPLLCLFYVSMTLYTKGYKMGISPQNPICIQF